MSLVETHTGNECRFHSCAPTSDLKYLTISVDNPDEISIEGIYQQIKEDLDGFEIVLERIFGSRNIQEEILAARREFLGDDRPYTFIEGKPVSGEGLAGIQIIAVRPGGGIERVWTLSENGAPCGRAWKRHGVTFMLMQNLSTENSSAPRSEQAREMFVKTDRILSSQGATYKDVARTWLYLSDILDWYDEFNVARNDKYSRFGIMPQQSEQKIPLPASTGIEGDNPIGTACTMDALAIIANGSVVRPKVTQMSNPRQKDAFKYKSAFSRAACIEHPDFKEIQLSGTASIDESGKSCFVGDFTKQMELTLDNISSLLSLRGATLKDICSATVFLKREEDFNTYRQILTRRGLENLPAVCTVADVCREELLFELDGVVVKK